MEDLFAAGETNARAGLAVAVSPCARFAAILDARRRQEIVRSAPKQCRTHGFLTQLTAERHSPPGTASANCPVGSRSQWPYARSRGRGDAKKNA